MPNVLQKDSVGAKYVTYSVLGKYSMDYIAEGLRWVRNSVVSGRDQQVFGMSKVF